MLWLCHACITEKYMNWCYKHWCYDYAMLASPRNIWIDAINTDAMIMPCLHHQEIYEQMPCINLHYALSWYLTMWKNAILAKIFEMCTSCNDIKILLRSFTCWYLTIWWIATITIIQTCNVKFENECQALTSSSERNIMMGIMMGVLISLNDFNLSICLLNSKVLNSRMTYLKYGI